MPWSPRGSKRGPGENDKGGGVCVCRRVRVCVCLLRCHPSLESHSCCNPGQAGHFTAHHQIRKAAGQTGQPVDHGGIETDEISEAPGCWHSVLRLFSYHREV